MTRSKSILLRPLEALHRGWLAPAPPERLAVLRAALGLWVLYYIGERVELLARVARTDAALFAPTGVVGWLAEPLPPWLFDGMVALLLAVSVLFTLGAFHRVVGPLFASLLLVVLCYRNSWSMIYHNDNVVVFHALVLGFTPAAAAWSLDACGAVPGGSRAASWRFGWPVRLMALFTVAPYFLAGVAKIASPLGWHWAGGEVLRDQIAVDAIRKHALGEGVAPLAGMLHDQTWLFTAIGWLTLVLELGAPLFLLRRRLAMFWAVQAWAMHVGILLLMGITFRYQLAGLIFLPLFPVERPIRWLGRRWSGVGSPDSMACQWSAPGTALVLLDGECGFCSRFARFVIRRDPRAVFRFAALQGEAAAEWLGEEHPARRELRSVVLIEGRRVYTRSAAVLRIAMRLEGPLWRFAGLFLLMPRRLRDPLYDFVAARRHALVPASCPLPPEAGERARFVEG